jgi:hypothetical protein
MLLWQHRGIYADLNAEFTRIKKHEFSANLRIDLR